MSTGEYPYNLKFDRLAIEFDCADFLVEHPSA